MGALVRRGRPAAVVPVAPAYDPLVAGRTLALLGVGAPVEPFTEPDEVLALIRRTTLCGAAPECAGVNGCEIVQTYAK